MRQYEVYSITQWRFLTKMFNLILLKFLDLTSSLQEIQRTEEQV